MERHMATPQLNIRASHEAQARFEQIHAELNRQLPYGSLSYGQTFALIVASASAALARGELHVAAPPAPINPEPRPVTFRQQHESA